MGAAWRLVATGRATVWVAMCIAIGVAAGAALATGQVPLSPDIEPLWAAGSGVASGIGLYAGTTVFVAIVRRWPPFARHVEDVYDQRKGLPLVAALGLAAGIVGPAEEIFWRGLFQARLAQALPAAAAAGVTWAVYVMANVASGSLPIVAAAVVSGAVWGALALWTGGVLASVLCHAVWTGLMVAFPPEAARRHGVSVGSPVPP